MKLNFFLFLSVFFFFTICKAEHLFFKNISVRDGLPSNEIYNVFMDSKNRLFICTERGVGLFDGVTFRRFSLKDGLADNNVLGAYEDTLHRIWFSCLNGGLCFLDKGTIYNERNCSFLKIVDRPNSPYLFNTNYDGSFFISYDDVNFIISIAGNSVSKHKISGKGSNIYIRNICKKNKNLIVFSEAIRRKDQNKTDLLNFEGELDSNFNFKKEKLVEGYHFLKSKVGFAKDFSSRKKVYCFNTFDKRVDTIDYSKIPKINRIYSLLNNMGGSYFVCTDDGLYLYQNNRLEQITSFSVNAIVAISNDLLCFSSFSNGIFVGFRKMLLEKGYKMNLPNAKFNYVPDSKLNLLEFNKKLYESAAKKVVWDFEKYMLSVDVFQPKSLVANDTVFSLYDDKYFLFSKGYSKVHLANKLRITDNKSFQKVGNNLVVNRTHYISRIPIGLDGAEEILFKIHSNGDSIEKVYYLERISDTLCAFSSNSGFYTINIFTKKIQKIFGNTYMPFEAFEDGSFAFLNSQGKIEFMERNKDKFELVNIPMLNGHDIYKIIKVDGSFLYFESNLGTFQLKRAPNKLFEVRALLLNDLSLGNINFDILNDSVFFELGGLLFKNSQNNLFSKINSGPITLNELKVNGRIVGYHKDLVLEENVALDFFFEKPFMLNDKFHYYYSIGNTGLREFDGSRLSIGSLGSGSKVLRVIKISDADQKMEDMVINFKVAKPKWRSTIAIISYILLILASLYFFTRLYIKSVLKRKNKEHDAEIALLSAEYKYLNALMNPHFLFNAINSIQYSIGINTTNAKLYLNMLSKILRQNIYNVQRDTVTLADEIELVQNYVELEQLRFKNLTYTLFIADDVIIEDVSLPPLVLQPLVENAIKHGLDFLSTGQKLHLQLNIMCDDENLLLEVIDNSKQLSTGINGLEGFNIGLRGISERFRKMKKLYKKDVQIVTSVINDNEEKIGFKAQIKIKLD